MVESGRHGQSAVSEVARRQHGYVSNRQLRAIGYTRKHIRTLQAHGALHPIHHGVYAVGHTAVTPLGGEAAALLALSGRAVLSHITALRMYDLVGMERAPIHLTVAAGSTAPRRSGIEVHRSRTLTPKLIRMVSGMPVTVPERALLDSAPLLTGRQLERAVDEALVRRLTSLTKLSTLIREHAGHPGKGLMATVVEQRRHPTVTESEAEERFLALVRDAGLPVPRTQVELHGFRVDAYWPQARLAVEIDGLQWHNRTKRSFERDRRKQQVLQEHEIEVARTTWDQITGEGTRLVAHLAKRLALRSEQR